MPVEDMIILARIGECNQCGGCCGFEAGSPWPKRWLDRHRDKQFSAWLEEFPLAGLLGIGAGEDGRTEPISLRGVSVVDGREFPYVWQDGQPCQDLTPDEKEATPTGRCPFLMDAEDGTKPCGLYGTGQHDVWFVTCSGRSDGSRGIPPQNYREDYARQWLTDYPNCSYRWE